jgi:hypothetical protein
MRNNADKNSEVAALDRASQAVLGKHLRALHEMMLSEEIPEPIANRLSCLDRAVRARRLERKLYDSDRRPPNISRR